MKVSSSWHGNSWVEIPSHLNPHTTMSSPANSLPHQQQNLYFSPLQPPEYADAPPPTSAPYKLIQLPSEQVLEEILQHCRNQSNAADSLPVAFTLKQTTDNQVNLCTQDKSFQMVHVEYSNHMHVVREGSREGLKEGPREGRKETPNKAANKDPKETPPHTLIMETTPIRTVYELESVCGQREKIIRELKKILPPVTLEDDSELSVKPKSFSDLEEKIAASPREIFHTLKQADAIQVSDSGDFIQFTLKDLRRSVVYVTLFLQACEDENPTLRQAKEGSQITKPEWSLQPFCPLPAEDNGFPSLFLTNDDQPLNIDKQKLALYYAEYILFYKKKKFLVAKFLEIWQKKMDHVCRIQLAWLFEAGLCIQRDDEETILREGDAVIEYYPASELPLDPKERFRKLFAKRKEWTARQLEPYLRPLATAQVPVEKLMDKYTKGNQTFGRGERKFRHR